MQKSKDKNIHVWPDLVFIEFLTAVALTIILIVWSLLINAPLLEIADPGISENPSKAPWYFVGLQELLVYFDPWIAGVMIPAIIIMCLVIIPYIDSNEGPVGEYSFSLRKFSIINFVTGFFMWLILIFIGYFMRGPDWQFCKPWEPWEAAVSAAQNLRSLAPATGISGMVLYFGIGMAAPRLFFRKFFYRCGTLRYTIIMTSVLLMYFVPVKIFLRLAFDIKYILVTPWFNV